MKNKVIKKEKKSPFDFWKYMNRSERLLVLTPIIALLIVAAALAAYIIWSPWSNETSTAPSIANDPKFSTEGEWVSFPDFGLDIRVPVDPVNEPLTDGSESYQRIHATRDKGGLCEQGFGVIVMPEVDADYTDPEQQLASLVAAANPLVSQAIATAFRGTQPTMSLSFGTYKTDNGTVVVEGSGDAEIYIAMQSSKDETDQWSEAAPAQVYYNLVVYQGRPIIVWGIWDWIAYNGEELTYAAVKDAIISIKETSPGSFVAPVVANSTQVTIAPVESVPYIDMETAEQNIKPYDPETGSIVYDETPEEEPYDPNNHTHDAVSTEPIEEVHNHE